MMDNNVDNKNEKDFTNVFKEELTLDSILKRVPKDVMMTHSFFPLSFSEGVLEIGVVKKDDTLRDNVLRFLTHTLNITYTKTPITQAEFDKKIQDLEKQSLSDIHVNEDIFEEFEESSAAVDIDTAFDDDKEKESKDIVYSSPVVNLVKQILLNAVEEGVSDIHIEPRVENGVVRFRVDGTLYVKLTFPKKIYSAVVSRIKILSKLRLDERRRPQDGRFSISFQDNKVDFRIAVFPTVRGQKVILRVLNRASAQKNISDLGLEDFQENIMRDIIRKYSYGLVLVTGPTGSGKTVTIYSVLELIDKTEKNIISLEDPVEISVDDISQSQIFPEIGYSFATGLRSVLRGDPDVIFVGEIRDAETAKLAVQAALTGHLVFSTLHTNSAVGAITRLRNLGVESFLIASVLRLVVAQRLVRTFRKDVAEKIPIDISKKAIIEEEMNHIPKDIKNTIFPLDSLYQVPKDSEGEGMKGRTGVFELFEVTPTIQKDILRNKSEGIILNKLYKDGYITLKQHGFLKSIKGVTSFEEAVKLGSSILDSVEGEVNVSSPSDDLEVL